MCASNCSIVVLVDGYRDSPKRWYMTITAAVSALAPSVQPVIAAAAVRIMADNIVRQRERPRGWYTVIEIARRVVISNPESGTASLIFPASMPKYKCHTEASKNSTYQNSGAIGDEMKWLGEIE